MGTIAIIAEILSLTPAAMSEFRGLFASGGIQSEADVTSALAKVKADEKRAEIEWAKDLPGLDEAD